MSIATVILAAGQGSRMNSDLPKVLHKIAGAPLLEHVMRCSMAINAEKTVVVVGHGGETVEKLAQSVDETALIAWQKDQNGTGHAVQQAELALKDHTGDTIILYGDTPFITAETLNQMCEKRAAGAV